MPWNATGHVVLRWANPPDEHNIFKNIPQDFILSPVTGRKRTNNISHPQMTSEFHACLLQHLDLINGSRGQHDVGGRNVGGPCGGGERSKGQSHKSRVINHFCHSVLHIYYSWRSWSTLFGPRSSQSESESE